LPLTADFTTVESLAFPNQVTLTDISTGSDPSITVRWVFFQLADGTYLVEDGTTTDYEIWPLADTSKTFDILSRSQDINITVQWLNGTTVVTQKLILNGLDLYDYLFGYEKVQILTSKPKLFDDVNFYNSMVRLDVNLFCEGIAITIGDDLYSAQQCLNRNYDLIQNQMVFF
jgi:hypothetical protein